MGQFGQVQIGTVERYIKGLNKILDIISGLFG